jgi:hypothetical protein
MRNTMRSISFGGSAHLAPFGASGTSTFNDLCSAGTGIVNASQRPSGDHARFAGDSMKWLIEAVTPLCTQWTKSCGEPSAAPATYAMRPPSGDHRG